MFARRRPLLRAAVVGGGAYVAGKRASQRSADQDQPAQSSAPASTQPEPATDAGSVADQLSQISALHEQGALSDAEFAAAKQKLLGA
jgi:hypothetical protein